MRPIDFIVYYCMQTFKTGNLNYSTPLGRACGGVGFIIGSLVITIIEFVVYLAAGYKITDHQIPFIIIFAGIYLLMGAIAYYIYHNKKRYQYITSSQYKPFKYTNTIGLTISVVAYVLSMTLMCAASVYIKDYI
jgi:hypothetical protein